MRLPQKIIDFYSKYEPSDCMEFGDIRLWPISRLTIEHQEWDPGLSLLPYNYVVFATSDCGDVYCFDLNRIDKNGNPKIVFFFNGDKYEDMTTAEIAEHAETITDSLDEFLKLEIEKS